MSPEAEAIAAALEAAHGARAPGDIIAAALDRFGADAIAAVSSFGADSAVLLHMIAENDRSIPVILLDTGKHFGETLDYRYLLVSDLGLRNLRVVSPLPRRVATEDPAGDLHAIDADACCALRKVEPMARAVAPYAGWFTGRKRFQTAGRASLPAFEAVGPRMRVNPLAAWNGAHIGAYVRDHGLREHPLVAFGYLSIGCFPCTQAVAPSADARSGRWAGRAKTECGIHLPGLAQDLAARRLDTERVPA